MDDELTEDQRRELDDLVAFIEDHGGRLAPVRQTPPCRVCSGTPVLGLCWTHAALWVWAVRAVGEVRRAK